MSFFNWAKNLAGSAGSAPWEAARPRIGTDSSTGSPVYLTDPNAVASKAGGEVQQGAHELGGKISTSEQDLNKGVTADTASLTGAGLGITQYIGNLVYDVLPRVAGGIGVNKMLDPNNVEINRSYKLSGWTISRLIS